MGTVVRRRAGEGLGEGGKWSPRRRAGIGDTRGESTGAGDARVLVIVRVTVRVTVFVTMVWARGVPGSWSQWARHCWTVHSHGIPWLSSATSVTVVVVFVTRTRHQRRRYAYNI